MQRRSFVTAVLTGLSGLFGVRQVAKAETKKCEKWCVECITARFDNCPAITPESFCTYEDEVKWMQKSQCNDPSAVPDPHFPSWVSVKTGNKTFRSHSYAWVVAPLGEFDTYEEAEAAESKFIEELVMKHPHYESSPHMTRPITRISKPLYPGLSTEGLREIAEKRLGINKSL